MPPPLCTAAHFETIDDLCKDSRLPKDFRAAAAIQRQVAQFSTALDSKIDFRTRFSLIKMYEHEIDRIQTTFADSWSDELELNWLAAKIFLVGMAFISNNEPSNQTETENRAIGAREMLQHGLSAASRLLSTISNIRLPPTQPGENKTGCSDYVYQLGFYPKQTFRIGAFANFYLLWYLAVDAQASDADKELAKTWVTFTYRLLGAFKHSPEHLRAAKGVELMSRLRPSEQSAGNQLVVTSRLGASIMYSYHFRDCNRVITTNTQSNNDNHSIHKKRIAAPTLGLDTVDDYEHSPNSSLPDILSSRTHPDGAARVEELSSPDSDGRGPKIRLDDFSIAYGRDRDPEPSSLSSPDGSTTHSTAQSTTQSTGQSSAGRSSAALKTPSRQSSSQGAPGGTLPPGQYPLPPADFNSLFSNAFFQDAGNQEFDFLWQEWDPAVFDDLKMDVDSSGVAGGN